MKVVFLEDVYGVAKGGDIKEVKNGFARNFLIPQNIAVPASHDALLRAKSLANKADTERVKIMANMQELADSINGSEISIEMRSGANRRLYGSVNTALIATELSKTSNREIDRRFITINDPIRELGEFEIGVRFHHEISATIKLSVVSEDSPEDAVETESIESTLDSDTSDSISENVDDVENVSTDVEENEHTASA